MDKDRIRILLTKSETDAHDRGILTVAAGLRDAGLEVIFTRFLFPEQVVKSALDEDVDAIGVGSLIGGHKEVASDLMHHLRENNLEHVTVILGGVIPDSDIPELEKMGIARVFGPGTPMPEIVNFLTRSIKK
ncbi:MAG: cobalamin B12-binding domain-containing protein [Chloroflexi bacterium]|nr:cobalamin B12-binding domain-containing protein [Chloroflexota bacterium]